MKIVVIDDTIINITLIDSLIKKNIGFTPITFVSPKDALNWCLNNSPDLIIVDYMMPDINGIDFIKLFREKINSKSVPILMITADLDIKVKHEALALGANDFLTKPFDRLETISRIKNMLLIREAYLATERKAEELEIEVLKITEHMRNREREIVVRLAKAAEFRDTETGEHVHRIAHYSKVIARELKLPAKVQQLIFEVSPMHDVGKLGIPDNILQKPGKLTPEEYEIMKGHSIIGWEILKNSGIALLDAAAVIAYTHHEKFDGTGYPQGLKGEEIPIEGRIVALADVFDALTFPRVYKKAWTIDDALNLIKEGKGKHFDPTCVDIFLSNIEEILEIRELLKN